MRLSCSDKKLLRPGITVYFLVLTVCALTKRVMPWVTVTVNWGIIKNPFPLHSLLHHGILYCIALLVKLCNLADLLYTFFY